MHRALPRRDPRVQVSTIPVSATASPNHRAEAPSCAGQLVYSRGRHLGDVLPCPEHLPWRPLGNIALCPHPFPLEQVQGVGGGTGAAGFQASTDQLLCRFVGADRTLFTWMHTRHSQLQPSREVLRRCPSPGVTRTLSLTLPMAPSSWVPAVTVALGAVSRSPTLAGTEFWLRPGLHLCP